MSLPTTNLAEHYVAGTGVSATGSLVDSWADQSGNGYVATGTTTTRPTATTDHNGNAILRFGGGKRLLTNGPAYSGRAVTIWALVRNAGGAMVGLTGYGGGTAHLRTSTVDFLTAPFTIYSVSRNSTIPLPLNLSMIGVRCSGTATTFYTQSTATTSATAVTNGSGTGGLEIGTFNNTSASSMELYELAVYSGPQSDADASNTRDYFAARAATLLGGQPLPSAYANILVVEGDSITAGTGTTDNQAWPLLLADDLGIVPTWRVDTRALSGAKIYDSNAGNSNTLVKRATGTDAALPFGSSRKVLSILIGRNDAAIPDNSADLYANLITYVQARVTAGWEVWVGLPIASTSLQTTLDAFKAKILGTVRGGTGNGIIADAGAVRIVPYGVDPRFDAAGDSGSGTYYAGDQTHPSNAGSAVLANIAKPGLYANGFVVSGPAAGTYTVTRAAGTFNGVEAVILGASAGTIIATSASGLVTNNNSGAVTVKPMDGATSFSFTPSGSMTITYANGQDWTNPSATTFAASDPDSSSNSSASSDSSASSASSDSSSSPSSLSSASSASSPSSASSESSSSGSSASSVSSASSPSSASSGSSSSRSSLSGDSISTSSASTSSSSSSLSSSSFSSPSSRSSASSASSSSSSGTDSIAPPPLNAVPARNLYPTIYINDDDAGRIVKIDEMAYRYAETPTLEGPVTIEMESPYSNSEIRYTLNGKLPASHSRLYTGPIVFRQNATGDHTAIRARIYDKTNANVKGRIVRLNFRVIPSR